MGQHEGMVATAVQPAPRHARCQDLKHSLWRNSRSHGFAEEAVLHGSLDEVLPRQHLSRLEFSGQVQIVSHRRRVFEGGFQDVAAIKRVAV